MYIHVLYYIFLLKLFHSCSILYNICYPKYSHIRNRAELGQLSNNWELLAVQTETKTKWSSKVKVHCAIQNKTTVSRWAIQ